MVAGSSPAWPTAQFFGYEPVGLLRRLVDERPATQRSPAIAAPTIAIATVKPAYHGLPTSLPEVRACTTTIANCKYESMWILRQSVCGIFFIIIDVICTAARMY